MFDIKTLKPIGTEFAVSVVCCVQVVHRPIAVLCWTLFCAWFSPPRAWFYCYIVRSVRMCDENG